MDHDRINDQEGRMDEAHFFVWDKMQCGNNKKSTQVTVYIKKQMYGFFCQ